MKIVLSLLACTLAAGAALAQQEPDREYRPTFTPAFAQGEGPVVCVDQAHFNFHTLEGRFFAFGQLLRDDGFRTQANTRKLAASALAECRVLVISNAQPSDAEWDDYPYPTPSAFTETEIAAVRDWVMGGGSLLLIADHMPLAGAAARLAAAFEVEFHDGFAQRDAPSREPDLFTRGNGGLRDHPITRGGDGESVDSVRTFTGQAFRASRAQPLLVFPAGYQQLLPEKAWQFNAQTPRVPVAGWLQGAVQETGQGRVAFFGEAAMFSAQRAGPDRRPMGMNSPGAEQNHRLVLNLLHWLVRKL